MDTWVRKAGTLTDRAPAKSKMLVRQFLEARLQACKSAKLSTTFSPDGLCRQRFLVAVLIELYVLAEPKELPDSQPQQQPAVLTEGDGVDEWMVAFWSHCARSSSSPPSTALALMRLLGSTEGPVIESLRDWKLIWMFLPSQILDNGTQGDVASLSDREAGVYLSKLACLAGLGRLSEAFDLLLQVLVERSGDVNNGDGTQRQDHSHLSMEGA